MVSVVFYNFSKKRNSTKRPSGSGLGSFDCVLKAPSGVISPTVFLGGVSATLPRDANYAYISAFSRYYFVTDWTWEEGGWTARLAVDVLATYKTQIGSSSQYVTRAQSTYNRNVIDDMIPTVAKPATQKSAFRYLVGASTYYRLSDPFPYKNITQGWYVVGIVNSDTNAVGGCSYYCMTDSNFRAFKGLLMDINNFTLDATYQDTLRAQFNPISYISSVRWFPCDIPRDDTPLSTLPFGWWALSGSFNAFKITGAPAVISRRSGGGNMPKTEVVTTDGYYVGIPHHPQSGVVHSNVDNDKYCKYTFECHPFGVFPLNADIVANTSDLYLAIAVDPVSGMGSMRLTAQGIKDTIGDMQVELASGSTKIGVDIPMAQIAKDNLAIASSSLSVGENLMAAISGNVAGGLFGAAQSGISYLASQVPQVRTSGAMGSLAEYYQVTMPTVVAEFYLLTDEAPARLGYPVCQNLTISSLSGFVRCGNVELDLPATETEQDQVVAMMTGGFEYE